MDPEVLTAGKGSSHQRPAIRQPEAAHTFSLKHNQRVVARSPGLPDILGHCPGPLSSPSQSPVIKTAPRGRPERRA